MARYKINTAKKYCGNWFHVLVDTETESCQMHGNGFQIVRGPTYTRDSAPPSYMTRIRDELNA